MRILVLQLARFGDIYQTWPVLKGLQRTRPSAEVHVLARQRFAEALQGCAGIVVHEWPTHEILAPIVTGDEGQTPSVEQLSLERLERAAQPLVDMQFDVIINLTFSPFSSYLVDLLSGAGTEVRGYTRHTDGHLHIPDDSSAYFYAQTGIGRSNRYHVTELFAAVAGVDLVDADHWQATVVDRGQRRGIVVHLGASVENKTYLPERWVAALREITLASSEPIALVGSASERPLSETVASQIGSENLTNRVGQSSLTELMQWISSARLLIGADSAPIHMAALTDTPVLNLSSDAVNFWETGPRSAGSRVLYAPSLQSLSAATVAREALAMLSGEGPIAPCAVREGLSTPYRLHHLKLDDFSWRLIEALYTGSEYPKADTREDTLAFQRLFELSELALQQLDRWDNAKARIFASQILGQVDQLLPEIARLSPRIEPAIQWFETERLRIPPGEASETLKRTRVAFENLRWVAAVYRTYQDPAHELRQAVSLCTQIAPELREYQYSQVQSAVQSLISTLQELSRHTTHIGGQTWSEVLREFDRCLESRDFIAMADFLEWKLTPSLSAGLDLGPSSPLRTDMLS